MQLYDLKGKRLYLTPEERNQFLEAAKTTAREVRTFCTVMYYTGCRISEALQLTPRRIDFSGKVLVFETLKKRRKVVFRVVPVPQEVLDALDMAHGIRKPRKSKKSDLDEPLWPWSRKTAYTRIIEVMDAAGIKDGPHKCPKGLRHDFGIKAIMDGVPLNMLKKWMGHAKLETTEIYTNAVGEQERDIAARMWR